MKTETVYWPEPKDTNIAQFVLYLRDITDDQRKVVSLVANGGSPLTANKLKIFTSAILEGITVYEGYIKQTIKVGGVIFNQAAADGLKENWLYIKTRLESYLNVEETCNDYVEHR